MLIAVALVLTLILSSAQASADLPRMFTYTTVKGDNLRSIAKNQLIIPSNWQLLQQTNALKNPDVIAIGSRIKIPVDAMRMVAAPVQVLSVVGITEANGSVVKSGEMLNEGSKISTGDDGFVTLQLADGSILTVQSKSSVRLENTKQFANANGVTDSVIRLDSGRVETNVTKQRNSGGRFEIRTPTSNMGVRGTVFRVAADSAGTRASSEVLEGLVGVRSVATRAGGDVALNKGFGTVAEAGKAPLPPIALLPAPATSALAKRVNAPNIEFNFAAAAKALKYRGQIARDQAFSNPVADVLGEATGGSVKIRFAAAAVGKYFLRVRAIDSLGLEGNNGEHVFEVVEPLATPVLNALVNGKFVWNPVAGATAYRLQVSNDEKFNALLLDEASLTTASYAPAIPLGYGNYFWRVLAIGEGGVQGIFSAGQNLLIQGRPLRLDTPTVDQNSGRITLHWQGEMNLHMSLQYQLQIARDEWFHDIVLNNRVASQTLSTATGAPRAPTLLIDALPKGLYFARVRIVSVLADSEIIEGITPWSKTRNIDVYKGWFNLIPALGPALMPALMPALLPAQ